MVRTPEEAGVDAAREIERLRALDDGDHVFLITSGSYSDYTVHAAFRRADDALTYVRTVNRNEIRIRHDTDVASGYVPPNAHMACRDPIETCPSCAVYLAYGLDWTYRVEDCVLYPSGVVPAFPFDDRSYR